MLGCGVSHAHINLDSIVAYERAMCFEWLLQRCNAVVTATMHMCFEWCSPGIQL